MAINYNNAINSTLGSLTAHGIVVAESTSPAVSKVLTNGQLLIGSTGDPVAATLTAGQNMTIANGAGSITLSSLPMQWINVGDSGGSRTPSPNTGYLLYSTTTITFNLPSNPAVGDTYSFIQLGKSGNLIITAPGVQIYKPSDGSTLYRNVILGSLSTPFLNTSSAITLVCVNVPTTPTWATLSSIGSEISYYQ